MDKGEAVLELMVVPLVNANRSRLAKTMRAPDQRPSRLGLNFGLCVVRWIHPDNTPYYPRL
jgi:hypothetical protein